MSAGRVTTTVLVILMLALWGRPAAAIPINIVSPTLTHFASFVNDPASVFGGSPIGGIT